ncbi:MAG: dihydrolipoyl dehydrogenase [Prevotellaceae bacterium]|jgi:dihydrolipoamide dehydrogenase|nr:dihydrolipoyl dehydrogenase [Prevotellaceae bacterium]
MRYDVIVTGSGPGGYVAAICAAQHKFKTALVEYSDAGGVCLNRGCIPAKTLLKSVSVLENCRHAGEYGIIAGECNPDIEKIVARARNVSQTMSRGVDFLLKKNGIYLIRGHGRLLAPDTMEIDGNKTITASHIILATGARPKELPNLPIDEKYVKSYKTALFPEHIPASMLVVGSGAIGTELACFYNAVGTKVTMVEYLPRIVPLEDEDVSAQLSRSLRKSGIRVMTDSSVDSLVVGSNGCTASISTKKGKETAVYEQILSAVGVTANIENLGLETLGVEIINGKIATDRFYRTNVEGVYAIGDVIATPSLAHVASAEAIVCVEKIAGVGVPPIDYTNIPSCIYTNPEIASVGLTEKQATESGLPFRVGKFPYTASGKAAATGCRDGFVKLLFDNNSDKLIGAHLVGSGVTEMIAGLVAAKKFELTAAQLHSIIHPHPTMSEAIMEAAAAAHNQCIHL